MLREEPTAKKGPNVTRPKAKDERLKKKWRFSLLCIYKYFIYSKIQLIIYDSEISEETKYFEFLLLFYFLVFIFTFQFFWSHFKTAPSYENQQLWTKPSTQTQHTSSAVLPAINVLGHFICFFG